MTHGHPFWWLLVWAAVAWYTSVTVLVAVRGLFDIRRMLRQLSQRPPPADEFDRPASGS